MSDTPRTDEQINGKPCTRFAILAGDSLRNASVPSEFSRGLERELNAANEMFRKLNIHALNLTDRIRRLEDAGDAMAAWLSDPRNLGDDPFMASQWHKAKEAKL